MGKGGRYLQNAPAAAPKKKMNKGVKAALIVVAVLIVLVLVILGGILWFLNGSGGMESFLNRVTQAKDVTVPTQEATIPPDLVVVEVDETDPSGETVPTETDPMETWPEVQSDSNLTTFMLVGQNYRGGPDGEESYLSDSMIMVTLNRETKTLTMTSIMRDLYVTIPAYAGHSQGANRINVNYHLGTVWTGSRQGGMEMLAECVKLNFGIPIDHTIEVGFDAFVEIIDKMGGVDIELTEAEAKYLSENVGYVERTLEPGLQTLDGWEALAYARTRKIDGDEQRTARQRNLIITLLKKCMSMNLLELRDLAYEVLPMVTTDMETEEMKNYILEFLPMLADLKIVSQVLPIPNDILKEEMGVASNWPKKITVGGYDAYVIQCNTTANGKYLRQQLGYESADE